MTTKEFFISNIKLTAASVCLCTVATVLASWLLGIFFFNEAVMFHLNGGGINTQLLVDYDQFRSRMTWFGACTGVIIAQAVFATEHLAKR